MKDLTPEEALRIVRFRAALHNSLCIVFLTIGFCAFVVMIGFLEIDHWGAAAATFAGILFCCLCGWIADFHANIARMTEEKILARYFTEAR